MQHGVFVLTARRAQLLLPACSKSAHLRKQHLQQFVITITTNIVFGGQLARGIKSVDAKRYD